MMRYYSITIDPYSLIYNRKVTEIKEKAEKNQMTLFITLTFMIFTTATILAILSLGMYLEYRKGEKVITKSFHPFTYNELAHQEAKRYENSLKAVAS